MGQFSSSKDGEPQKPMMQGRSGMGGPTSSSSGMMGMGGPNNMMGVPSMTGPSMGAPSMGGPPHLTAQMPTGSHASYLGNDTKPMLQMGQPGMASSGLGNMSTTQQLLKQPLMSSGGPSAPPSFMTNKQPQQQQQGYGAQMPRGPSSATKTPMMAPGYPPMGVSSLGGPGLNTSMSGPVMGNSMGGPGMGSSLGGPAMSGSMTGAMNPPMGGGMSGSMGGPGMPNSMGHGMGGPTGHNSAMYHQHQQYMNDRMMNQQNASQFGGQPNTQYLGPPQ